MPEGEGQEQKKEAAAPAGFMVGSRGWIILIASVVIEAVFFFGLWMFKDRTVATPTSDATSTKPTAEDINKEVVVLKDLNYTIPTATSQIKTLAAEINIVLERSPEEIQQNITIGPADWARFKGAVEKMIPAIRDQLMSYLTKQSYSQLNSERGKQMLRDFIKDYINDELGKVDLQLDDKDLTSKRVSKIYIVSFIMQ